MIVRSVKGKFFIFFIHLRGSITRSLCFVLHFSPAVYADFKDLISQILMEVLFLSTQSHVKNPFASLSCTPRPFGTTRFSDHRLLMMQAASQGGSPMGSSARSFVAGPQSRQVPGIIIKYWDSLAPTHTYRGYRLAVFYFLYHAAMCSFQFFHLFLRF